MVYLVLILALSGFGTGGLLIPTVFAAVTVTPASGGTSISADTAGGAFTSLTGPVIAEGVTADIGAGTIILNAPSGFIFDTGGVAPTVLVTRTAGTGNDNRNINDLASGSTISVTVSSTQFSITISAATSNSVTNSLTWQNMRVRPSAGTPLASGNIVKTGTASISGVIDSVTDLGALAETVGAFDHITVTPSGSQSVAIGATITFSAQGYDLNNNPVSGLTFVWAVVAGTGSGNISSDGTLTSVISGTLMVTATSGAITGSSGTVTVTNVPPSFDAIANQSVDENSSSQNIYITNVSASESDQTVTMSAVSSNTELIPNPVISGSGSTRTLEYAPSTNMAGTATITVTADDGQANNNTYARIFTITVIEDTTAPGAPSAPDLNSSSDSGSSDADNITNVATPTFTLTAESGSSIKIYDTDGATIIGIGDPTTGIYVIAVSSLSNGVHSITAKATDVAGNVSSASDALLVTIDAEAPSVPVIASIAGDNIISNSEKTRITVAGTAESNSTVSVSLTSVETVIGSGIADDSGVYSVTIDGAILTDGAVTPSVTATDTAGNTSSFAATPTAIMNTQAAEDSITVNSAVITLAEDANDNGIFNIGDAIRVEINLDNTDGGCSEVGGNITADLRKYGGDSAAGLSCVADNGGVGDVFSVDFYSENSPIIGIDVGANDDASKVTIIYGDSNDLGASFETDAMAEPVDTIAPAFADTDSLQILTQDGADPAVTTRVWYYYEGNSFRLRFTAAPESDGNPLASVKLCLAGVIDGESDYECYGSDFDTDDYYTDFNLADLPGNDVIWELNELIDYFPELGGYVMNLQLTDDAGNTTVSALPEQMFVAAFGIDPKLFNEALNNEVTTDWASISDFTDVPELVFSAMDYDDELSQYTNTEIGRLTIGNAENHLNLTDSDTIAGLSNFGNNLTISGEEMRVDSSVLEALNLPAELRMRVDTAVRPGLIVKGNDGTTRGYASDDASEDALIFWEEEVCDDGEENCETVEYSRTIGGFSWNSDFQMLTFTTTGFSEFETDNNPPTVSPLAAESGDYVISFGGGDAVWLTFSEPLSSVAKTAVENAISAGADHEPGSYEWSDDLSLGILPNAEFNIIFANDVIADVEDKAGNSADNLLLIDSVLDENQQEGGADVEVSADGDEIIISDGDAANSITIPDGVDDVTIDVGNLVTDGEGILPEITISAATSAGDVTVSIPDGVTVSGGALWLGIINVPTVKANDSVSGVDGVVDSVIEVGFGSTELTFNKGARLLIEGKAGKRIGYSHGAAFTEITSICADNSQVTGDALAAGADCKIDAGSDLIVWTKHFSSFVTFTSSASASASRDDGGIMGAGSIASYNYGPSPVTPVQISSISLPTIPTTPTILTVIQPAVQQELSQLVFSDAVNQNLETENSAPQTIAPLREQNPKNSLIANVADFINNLDVVSAVESAVKIVFQPFIYLKNLFARFFFN